MSLRAGIDVAELDEGRRARSYRIATTALAYLIPGVFILLPLILFLVQSFYYVDHGKEVHELTLRNYVRFFNDAAFVPVFLRTCILCLAVAVIAVAFAYPVAYLLASIEGRTAVVPSDLIAQAELRLTESVRAADEEGGFVPGFEGLEEAIREDLLAFFADRLKVQLDRKSVV